MLILCPHPDQQIAFGMLRDFEILENAQAVHELATLIHEQLPPVEVKVLQQHPTHLLWREDLVFAIDYAMAGLETIQRGRLKKRVRSLQEYLSYQLDLATTAEYRLETPSFWGSYAYHQSHQAYMVFLRPWAHADLIKSGVRPRHYLGWPKPVYRDA